MAQEQREPPRQWLVWSLEHQAWWRPTCAGYTRNVDEAGRFTRENAAEICENANTVAIEELMTPIPLRPRWTDPFQKN